MFDPEAIKIARKTMDAERFALSARFQDKVGRARGDAAMRGLAQSSVLIKLVADVCAEEIETRANRVWEVLNRALVTTGVGPSADLASELKIVFNEFFSVYCEDP